MSTLATLLPNGEQQFIDENGVPYEGGFVFFYIPSTNTLKNTWQDAEQTVLNTNPVVLDGAGRAVIFGVGDYRQILTDKDSNTIWDKFTAAGPDFANIDEPLTITVNSSDPALTVTQEGSGNVVTFQDADTDPTPVIINSDGNIVAGNTVALTVDGTDQAKIQVYAADTGAAYVAGRFSGDTSGPNLRLLKSRDGAIGGHTIVQLGDTLGAIRWLGDDGATYNSVGAQILAAVDGTPGVGDMPTYLAFGTTPDGSAAPTEKMRIDSTGGVGIGGTAVSSALLDIQSTTRGLHYPSMTTVQKLAIVSPTAGLFVYDTTLSTYSYYDGTQWVNGPNGGGGGGANQQNFTSSTTWNKPAGFSATAMTLIEGWGGGGGGGSFNGAGGSGGTTTFGSWVTAYGGGGASFSTSGAGGGYAATAGTTNDTGGDGTGGTNTVNPKGGFYTGGGGGAFSTAGSSAINTGASSVYGGGGGGGVFNSATGTSGGSSKYAGAGGSTGSSGTAPSGGGGGTTSQTGAGGGGGSYQYSWVLLGSLGATETVTVGAGGGGNSSAGSGAAGQVRVTVFPG